MRSATEAGDAIKRTWALACRRAGMDPAKASALPLLFAIDGQLAITEGFRYELDCTRALAAAQSAAVYCGTHIGCGGGCGGGCAGDGCTADAAEPELRRGLAGVCPPPRISATACARPVPPGACRHPRDAMPAA